VVWSLGRRVALGGLGVMESSGWTECCRGLKGRHLVALDMCHHRGIGQILTTTCAPRFPACRSLWKGSRGSEVDRMDLQCLSIYYDICGREVYDESLLITANLLESIADCVADCQLSHWSAGPLKGRILHLFESRHHHN